MADEPSDIDPRQQLAEERLQVLAEAIGAIDPDDDEAWRRLRHDDDARRRLSHADKLLRDLVASEAQEQPHLMERLKRGGGYVPGPDKGGPRDTSDGLLWDLRVRYERIGGLLEVYAGDDADSFFTVPIATLAQHPDHN
jgi:hypothetical protein